MKRLPGLFYWLAVAALVEWFLLRTVSRVAVHIPRSEAMTVVYQGVSLIGQVAGSLAMLLAFAALGWIAWHERQSRRAVWLPLALGGMAALSLIFLVAAPAGWLAATSHALSLTAVLLIVGRLRASVSSSGRTLLAGCAVLLPAGAIAMGLLYQFAPVFYETLRWPGPPPLMSLFFHVGELLVVSSALALWMVYGRGASRRTWLLSAIPALVLALAYLRDPAMTGVLAIWSTGLSLYLPWPLYAGSLWLAGVTVAAAWRQNSPASLALLLLLAGGYVPQLSTQLFLGVAALWLLVRAAAPDCSAQLSTRPLPRESQIVLRGI